MEPPLTAEQQARFDDYYPTQIRNLCAKKLGGLWRLYADESDALSQAAIGLLKAVRTFEAERGFAFNTLLFRCMQSALCDGLRKGASREVIRNKSRENKSDAPIVSTVSFEELKVGRDDSVLACLAEDTSEETERRNQLERSRDRVCRAFGLIAYEDRQVLYDLYYRGLTLAQIAWWRGKKKSEVYDRVRSAREKLRRAAKAGVV